MDQTTELTQASNLIKAGQKKQAIEILRQILEEDPENAPAWGLLAMAFDDADRRRQCLEEVIRIGDSRMVTWAHQHLAALTPAPEVEAPAPPQPASPSADMFSSINIPQTPAAPVAPAEPALEKPRRSLTPYLLGCGVVLVVICLVAAVVFAMPSLMRSPVVNGLLGVPTETPAPTATLRPTDTPWPTSTITNTPAPTATRTPRPTITPTSTLTVTPTLTLTPTGSVTPGGP
jgi:hypothetical protein